VLICDQVNVKTRRISYIDFNRLIIVSLKFIIVLYIWSKSLLNLRIEATQPWKLIWRSRQDQSSIWQVYVYEYQTDLFFNVDMLIFVSSLGWLTIESLMVDDYCWWDITISLTGLDYWWWINKLILQSYNWIYRVCVARILVLAMWFLREIVWQIVSWHISALVWPGLAKCLTSGCYRIAGALVIY